MSGGHGSGRAADTAHGAGRGQDQGRGGGPARAGAFFDVDGTLTKSDIFRDLSAFRGHAAPSAWWTATFPLRGLFLLALDLFSRKAVNRATYRWYRGLSSAELAAWARDFQAGPGMARLRERGLDLLVRHARAGHRLVLVTGAVDALVAPLPALLAARAGVPELMNARVEAVQLEERDGRFTGRLVGEPLGEDEKARRVRSVAAEEGLDLAASYAYGDSIADLPMLEAVGRPAAACPDGRLRRVARRRGWPVLELHEPVGTVAHQAASRPDGERAA